jgi:hypothetical protein
MLKLTEILILNWQHPVALHISDFVFHFLLAVYVECQLIFSLSLLFIVTKRQSGVQVVVMKESAFHCNAILLVLCSYLRLILGYVG